MHSLLESGAGEGSGSREAKANPITDSGSVVCSVTLPVLGLQMKMSDVDSAQSAALELQFFIFLL